MAKNSQVEIPFNKDFKHYLVKCDCPTQPLVVMAQSIDPSLYSGICKKCKKLHAEKQSEAQGREGADEKA